MATSVVKLALGLGFAVLLARPFRGRTLVFLAIFLPWAYPASESVIGCYWMLDPPISTAYAVSLGHLKDTVDSALGSRGSSFIGVLLLLTGLNAIPRELFEYALLESRSAWRRFRLVTVPLLKPFLALAVCLSLTSAFVDLANVWKLTGGASSGPPQRCRCC